MAARDDVLVWVDLEFTSLLDPKIDSITQIAVIVTDRNLKTIAEGEEMVIRADPERLDTLPEKNMQFLETQGLLPAIRASTLSEQEVEARVLAFLEPYVEPGTAPLCGNSIHTDRLFLRYRMPNLHDFFHYRNIDVSSLKELARAWRPELFSAVADMKSDKSHHALDDIRGSIAELKYYREHWLK